MTHTIGNLEAGLQSWRLKTNHNRMMELQEAGLSPRPGPVELAFFGSSAFRVTSPAGISVMLDPWRNHPSGKWDWYFRDMPLTAVDIGVSTHAHFDHVGNLHRFPKARFTIQDAEMESITGRDMTHPFFRTAYHQEDVEALVGLLYDNRLKFIRGDGSYAPGIDYHLIGGHSRGQMGLTVNTERGPVFLASDAIHLFQEVDQELPFIVFYDMAEMLEGYRTCARLAGERAFLVPGHDPIVTDIYPAVRPDLEGLVLDLGKAPKAVS